MKKLNFLIVLVLFTIGATAQGKYDYSLNYVETEGNVVRIALMATPNFTEANGNTADQGAIFSMSNNMYIKGLTNNCTTSGPPGNQSTTCDYDSFPGLEWAATYIEEDNGRYIYQIIRTEGAITFYTNAVAGTPIVMAVIEVVPTSGAATPVTTGSFRFAENGVYNLTENYMNVNFPSVGSTVNVLSSNPLTSVINFATLGTNKAQFTNVSIFPNPAKDTLNIVGLEHELSKVEIVNVTGQIIKTVTTNMETLDVSALNTGIYFLRLKNDTSERVLKFVKK